ncbi:transcriptional regulator domain-containing protein [Sphingobium sp. CAP-1]|uniref:transcriptional regulator domain-containing protein n=1 Tax=Sphingobium sp. CAP-1 TaxID=2676077 RepID=UPI001E630D65|nr:DUF6499 domain-containing protein [Sphingobium sp. CAP-1]
MPAPDPDAVEAVLRRGRTALAWEVLRRDSAYWAAFTGLAGASVAAAVADGAFERRWGLHFP